MNYSEDGSAAKWYIANVDVYVDSSVEEIAPDAFDIINAAFLEWRDIDGAYPPNITLHRDAVGINNISVSNNKSSNDLAITYIEYDDRGIVLSASIEVNNYNGKFSHPNKYDFQNVMTHEVGHFFGLNESPDPNSSMYAYSSVGETLKRTLSEDDEMGMKFLYGAPENSGCSFRANTHDNSFALFIFVVIVMAKTRYASNLFRVK